VVLRQLRHPFNDPHLSCWEGVLRGLPWATTPVASTQSVPSSTLTPLVGRLSSCQRATYYPDGMMRAAPSGSPCRS